MTPGVVGSMGRGSGYGIPPRKLCEDGVHGIPPPRKKASKWLVRATINPKTVPKRLTLTGGESTLQAVACSQLGEYKCLGEYSAMETKSAIAEVEVSFPEKQNDEGQFDEYKTGGQLSTRSCQGDRYLIPLYS